MPETVRTAPPPADLAGLIPAQRAAEPVAAGRSVPAAPSDPVVTGGPDGTTPVGTAPERLAFLWAMLGATAGAAVVAVAFLVLLTLLP